MELATETLSSVITKLGVLLTDEYILEKGVRWEIRFLQAELESIKGVVQKIYDTPADQLHDIHDKMWARELFDLSRDMKDSIDDFIVCVKGDESAKLHGIRKYLDQSVDLFRKAKIHQTIADEIRDIRSRLAEVHERRPRYEVNHGIDKPTRTTVDPRLFSHLSKVRIVKASDDHFENFKVLRVLELQGCDLSRGYTLEYLENLFHLRYLGLCDTHIAQLPKDIGNLEFLETLDVRGNNMFSLPSTILQLTNLMCLYIDEFTRVPNGIGSLTNLEVLSTLDITVSIDIIEELGQLMKLRKLHILLFIGWCGKLVECLHKLQNIKYLYIKIFGDRQCDFVGLDAWVAPRHLCRLDVEWPCWFSALPSWMNQSYLLDLVYLSIAVRDLGQVNLETLGRLPVLRKLKLSVDPKNLGTLGGFIVGAGLFPCLVFFQFGGSIGPIVFQQGAMPRLEILDFEFCVQAARQITSNDDGPDELGLGNLPSLLDVKIYLRSRGASRAEVKELEAVLRHEVEIHPNRSKHQICG